MGLLTDMTIRRKCFVSYYAGDRQAVDVFLRDYDDVFIPKAIGVSQGDDFIDSADSEYVMSRIRQKYLEDSTVTICLLGACTHGRRYVDWELKSSLTQGQYSPNGLVGILLPHLASAHLPDRFQANWNSDESIGYALYRAYPSSKQQLADFVEQAYRRRSTHAHLIRNGGSMFRYNSKCLVHGETH